MKKSGSATSSNSHVYNSLSNWGSPSSSLNYERPNSVGGVSNKTNPVFDKSLSTTISIGSGTEYGGRENFPNKFKKLSVISNHSPIHLLPLAFFVNHYNLVKKIME